MFCDYMFFNTARKKENASEYFSLDAEILEHTGILSIDDLWGVSRFRFR
jgi:hypothetical protein